MGVVENAQQTAVDLISASNTQIFTLLIPYFNLGFAAHATPLLLAEDTQYNLVMCVCVL